MARLHGCRNFGSEHGAAAVEFAFVAFPLILLTLGIIDFGFALYTWTQAEKAAHLGVRTAVVSDLVAPQLADFSGVTNQSAAGASCAAADGSTTSYCTYSPDPVVCTSTGCNGYGFSSSAFNKIITSMRTLYPSLGATKVEVEYASSPLGFAGRPGNSPGSFNLVPLVTVRIINLTYDWVALGSLLGLPAINLPDISATMPGEDLDSSTSL
ncbi:MAG TPA: TadE family protein [Woeseiaceae bacterium]|nr:TadE family protein [Woeseiaceae bacterium]